MKRLFLALLASSSFAATFYVDAGSSRFGNTRFNLNSQATVTTSGSVSSDQAGAVYFDVHGVLTIALPAGVSGTCSATPCNTFTAGDYGSHWISGAHQFATNGSQNLYNWVDPIFSTTTSQSGSYSLLANERTPIVGGEGIDTSTPYEVDTKFTVTQNGYILGIRFYRMPSDTTTDQLVTLYSDSGTALSAPTSFTGMTASGWQTAYFSTPVAVTAGQWYRASLHSSWGVLAGVGFFRNYSVVNGALRSASYYDGGNGANDPSDSIWPRTADGFTAGGTYPAAGIIGKVIFHSDGSISTISPPNGYSAGTIGAAPAAEDVIEGCQCMIGGTGPGPYTGINTYIEGSGNLWHHDDSGYNVAGNADGRFMGPRGDYYYYRMTWRDPTYTRLGSAASDGFRYFSRQLFEIKGGNRLYIGGSLFEGAYNDSVNSGVSMAQQNQLVGNSDINFEYNIVRHVPGGWIMGSMANHVVGGTTSAASAQARVRIANNLLYDLGAYAVSIATPGNAWVFEYPGGSEDLDFDHNTVMPLRGRLGTVFWLPKLHTEGYRVTNNILPIDSNYYGAHIESNDGINCGDGEAVITTCNQSSWTNYTFTHNLLYPEVASMLDRGTTWSSNTTAAGIRSHWPTLAPLNFIPSSTDLSTYGFYKLASVLNDSSAYSGTFDLRLRSGAIASSGNAAQYSATDTKDLGADMNAVLDAQGSVTLIGVPNSSLSATSATVAFIAPDAQACPVDYKVFSASDPNTIVGFTRVPDTGTNRVRNVQLTGLNSGTTYSYRINCAAEQPTGLFRTR